MRLSLGEGARLGRNAIQAPAEAAAGFESLRAAALNLLGHYRAAAAATQAAAQRHEREGRPGFSALWYALEDARVENRLLERWPGMARALAARQLPNLGGGLARRMPVLQQLELGLYLAGRGLPQARLSDPVLEALARAAPGVRSGADGAAASESLAAMLGCYAVLAAVLPPDRGGARPGRRPPAWMEQAGQGAGADADSLQSGAPGEGPPELELSDERTSVGLRGERRRLDDWYRPGSAPWFERGQAPKQVHPSARRADALTLIPPPDGDLVAYRALWAEVRGEVGPLATRVANLLREQSYLRYGGRYRSGKLNAARLWKQRLGSYRLFERPADGERSTALMLLVDESASMQTPGKMHTARKAAVLLGETLQRLGWPFEIIGFSTAEFEARAAMRLGLRPAHAYRSMRCSALAHRVYKAFDEPYTRVRHRLTGLEPRCNNWDDEHLPFAARRLLPRRARRKLLLVICDGQPNGEADHTLRAVAALQGLGCQVAGIGVGSETVREIYPTAIVVHEFRQLAQELLGLLARPPSLPGRPAGAGAGAGRRTAASTAAGR